MCTKLPPFVRSQFRRLPLLRLSGHSCSAIRGASQARLEEDPRSIYPDLPPPRPTVFAAVLIGEIVAVPYPHLHISSPSPPTSAGRGVDASSAPVAHVSS